MPKRWQPKHGKPLVCVYWDDADASSPTDAFYEEEIVHTPQPMETYGLLIKDDQDGVTIMNEFYLNENGKKTYRGRTTIPRSLVRDVVIMAEPYTPRKKAHHAKEVLAGNTGGAT